MHTHYFTHTHRHVCRRIIGIKHQPMQSDTVLSQNTLKYGIYANVVLLFKCLHIKTHRHPAALA